MMPAVYRYMRMFRIIGNILCRFVSTYDACFVQVCNEMPGQEEDQDERRRDVSFE